MTNTVAAAVSLGLLFLCVCVYSWARYRAAAPKRIREQAMANYRNDIESDR